MVVYTIHLSMQHSTQLQQDYEDTKAEMPWLQLEEENLDEVKSPPPANVKTRKPDLEQPAIVMVSVFVACVSL